MDISKKTRKTSGNQKLRKPRRSPPPPPIPELQDSSSDQASSQFPSTSQSREGLLQSSETMDSSSPTATGQTDRPPTPPAFPEYLQARFSAPPPPPLPDNFLELTLQGSLDKPTPPSPDIPIEIPADSPPPTENVLSENGDLLYPLNSQPTGALSAIQELDTPETTSELQDSGEVNELESTLSPSEPALHEPQEAPVQPDMEQGLPNGHVMEVLSGDLIGFSHSPTPDESVRTSEALTEAEENRPQEAADFQGSESQAETSGQLSSEAESADLSLHSPALEIEIETEAENAPLLDSQ